MVRYDSFESTFAIILLNVNLQPEKRRKMLKTYAYSCDAHEALAVMHETSFKLYYDENYTEVCISMSPEASMHLLHKYLYARLLHCPSVRGLTEIKSSTILQPTAKGVAVIEAFCKAFSVEHRYTETLFKSRLNTMTLLHLPHDNVTTHVKTSEAMLMVLWNRMLGAEPHEYPGKLKRRRGDRSPYWHQWLLHPHGNSMSQYYNSEGIRLFPDVEFKVKINRTEKRYTMDYVLSGRGIYQWLMDCTNIMHPSDAEAIAKMFVSREYLRIIPDKSSLEITTVDGFPKEISRSTLYRIAHRGHLMCRWSVQLLLDPLLRNADHWTTITSCDFPPVKSLEDIFVEPGLTMVFQHTMARLHASENFEFLRDLSEMEERFQSSLDDVTIKIPVMNAWQHAVGIIYRYITVGSPMEINIPTEMRHLIVDEVPQGKITYNEIIVRLDVIIRRLQLAREHIQELSTALIPHFTRDPILKQLPLIEKALNPPPPPPPFKFKKFDPAKLAVNRLRRTSASESPKDDLQVQTSV